MRPVAGHGINVTHFSPIGIDDPLSVAAQVFRERKMIAYAGTKTLEIMKAINPDIITGGPGSLPAHYDSAPYQSSAWVWSPARVPLMVCRLIACDSSFGAR